MNIYIDIKNNPLVLSYLKDELEKIKWTLGTNVINNHLWDSYPQKTARYFEIDFEFQSFAWSVSDDTDNKSQFDTIINTLSKAKELIEFITLNQNIFKEIPETTLSDKTLISTPKYNSAYNITRYIAN